MNLKYKEITEDVLNNFTKYYSKNPLNFFYESDIQGLIYSFLYSKHMKNENKIKIYENDWIPKIKEINRLVSPIKMEYPKSRKMTKYNRMDVGIINEKYDFEKVDNFWDLPLQIALEIKYCQYNESTRVKVVKKKDFYSRNEYTLNYDLYKLKKYSETHSLVNPTEFAGCGLLFVQHDDYRNYRRPSKKEDNIEYLERVFNIQKVDKISIDSGIDGWIIFSDGSIYWYEYD